METRNISWWTAACKLSNDRFLYTKALDDRQLSILFEGMAGDGRFPTVEELFTFCLFMSLAEGE